MTEQAPDKNGKQSATGRDAKGRFAPGNRGGPGRPPAEFSFTELLRAKVAERPQLIERLVKLAESEDENVALRTLLGIANRLDGMPKQSVEQEHRGGFDVSLRWDANERQDE